IIPDGNRSVPLPKVLPAIHDALAGRPASVTVLNALGTHAAMSEAAIDRLLRATEKGDAATHPEWTVLNHACDDPDEIADLGEIPAAQIAELTGGLLTDIPMRVQINKLVVDSDVNRIVGPVFPHEVVGFSGGNKYFFPGCSVHDV